MATLRTSALLATFGLCLSLAAISPALAQSAPPPDDDTPSPVPDGNGCAGAVARWQGMAGRENDGGHMDQSVYEQIQNEIDRASHLCEAGQDAQARKLVAQSMHRHGY